MLMILLICLLKKIIILKKLNLKINKNKINKIVNWIRLMNKFKMNYKNLFKNHNKVINISKIKLF